MAFAVDTVFVWVTDIVESVEWYTRFGVKPGASYGDWQTMEVTGATAFALHRGERPQGSSTAGIAFRVDDLDAEIARLAGLAIEPWDEEITETGVARFTTFRDPDGNDVQLLERPT